jgi:hypothetical protein
MDSKFQQLISSKLKYSLFLLKNLPSAYFSGLKLVAVSEEKCSISVPFKWFSKNPFRSTYFACLSMAAEMSTGILALGNIYGVNPGVSMLVVNATSNFYKKATDITTFTCNDGLLFQQKIQETINTKQPVTVTAKSDGYNKAGELVASFSFTWSFKAKG